MNLSATQIETLRYFVSKRTFTTPPSGTRAATLRALSLAGFIEARTRRSGYWSNPIRDTSGGEQYWKTYEYSEFSATDAGRAFVSQMESAPSGA